MSTNHIHAVEDYLSEIGKIRATHAGTGETSYYPPLSGLLNAIGETLSPKVRCVIQLQNRGAGMPDGGMFTADQFRTKAARQNPDRNPLSFLPPSRGVVEVKSPAETMASIVESEQIARYWDRHGLVLVTNYRAFALIGRTPSGKAVELEGFALAETEDAFWHLAAHPRSVPEPLKARFADYLGRAMTHNAPLASPQDLAAVLASYARDARARISETDLPALRGLRDALQNALGLAFEGEKGEHFFRSTLIQTLFYGIFSAWVIWARKHRSAPPASDGTLKQALRESASDYDDDDSHFDWQKAVWYLRVPMIRALFEQIATPARLGPLGVKEVLDWTGAALNRVQHEAFFAAFDEGHAVQYFYEPFLQAFDPELRKDLGVWYTPTEIVDYQVERVDAALRDELHIADGLADARVVVLDPCCGTGAYVHAVLRRIARTLNEKGADALTAHDLKKAALDRVIGFEILPAPFVIAHLQISLLLETLGAPLEDDSAERVGVYLTNSLTGWVPVQSPKDLVLFPEMAQERDAANTIKRRDSILVVIGNPPYNGFAGVALSEERDLSTAYRTTRLAPAPQGQGLNDLYVRFFRMAERRIVEMNPSGQGVISFISNYSWLDGLSFPGMRERYLEVFDRIEIDCLNGDKYKTGKLTPDGEPDPSAFSTEYNREGIQVGTAIATLIKVDAAPRRVTCEVDAASRRVTCEVDAASRRVSCEVDAAPRRVTSEVDAAPRRASSGGEAAAATSAASTLRFRHFWGRAKREDLLAGKGDYQVLSPAAELGFPFIPGHVATGYVGWPALPELFPTSFPGVKTSRDDFLVDIDRDRLLARLRGYFDPDVSHAAMRQLNPGVMEDTARFKGETTRDILRRRGVLPANVVRYCYRPFDVRWLYWEPETKLLDEKRSEYFPHVFDGNVWIEARQRQPQANFDHGYFVRHLADNFGSGLSNFFPLYFGATLLESEGRRPNLSEKAMAYLSGLNAEPAALFHHALAVLHAPAYRTENAGALRQDWPRIPLPATKEALLRSAELGCRVASLLDPETPMPGVSSGVIRDDLKGLAVFTRVDGAPVDPQAGDLDLTAGWGHAGKGGVTMPGRGRVETVDGALDIHLNEHCCWRNVPASVWEYTLGGYQVIKKWLSYREKALLGRGLAIDEVRYVTETARRIAALIALQPALDENYRFISVGTFTS